MKYSRRDAKKYTREHMTGVWAAIPYPFTDDGLIDEAGLRRDLRRYVDDLKIDGLFIGGLVGEVWSLTMDERRHGQQIVLDEVNGATQIIAHTGAASIRDTVALTQEAQKLGADLAITGNPPLNSRHPEVIRNFFEAVCAETDLGVGLFNTPISGYSLTPQQIAETMASHEVSPKGLGSAIRMVQYFINRYGKSRMEPAWLDRLNEAKRILQDKLRAQNAAGK